MPGLSGDQHDASYRGQFSCPIRPPHPLAAARELGTAPRSGNTGRIRPLRGRADSYSRESTNR